MGYTEIANRSYLNITPRELGITHQMFNADVSKLKDFYLPLVLKSPSCQSLYGRKISDINFGSGWQKSKNIQKLINEIIKGLHIKNNFEPFSCSKIDRTKRSLNDKILKNTIPCLFIKTDNGILESLFFCIRNALAHGDIVYRNGYYEFFSVKKANIEQDELDGEIIFYLKIKKISDLKGFLCIQKHL